MLPQEFSIFNVKPYLLLPPVTEIFEIATNFPQAFPSGIIVCDNQVISSELGLRVTQEKTWVFSFI